MGVGIGGRWLDLAFDVDFSEGLVLGCLEKVACLAGEEAKLMVLFFKKMLPAVFTNERCRIAVRLESKFLGDESQTELGLVPATG